ncbi:MAG: MBL fold metallo-hydrolase [Nitrososphaerales archaeon]
MKSEAKQEKVIDEIVEGLYKIRVPIPFRGLGHVFVYLARDDDQNLLVDTGWNDENSYNAIKSGFGELGFESRNLQNILISHAHPDHFGLAGRLKKEAPKAKLLMSQADAQRVLSSAAEPKVLVGEMESFVRMHGTPEEENGLMLEASVQMAQRFVDIPRPDAMLKGMETIKVGNLLEFKVILTPGHTRGNLCLYETRGSGLFFSGDHVLPTITPNISLSPLYPGDPLGDYLRSLEFVKKLSTRKVLPSHEFVFENLPRRVDEIGRHHEERLADVLNALGHGEMKTGYEVSTELHWHSGHWSMLSPWEKRSALTETLAHLEYLKRKNQIFEFQEGPGETKRVFYSRMS